MPVPRRATPKSAIKSVRQGACLSALRSAHQAHPTDEHLPSSGARMFLASACRLGAHKIKVQLEAQVKEYASEHHIVHM